jgi:hypothetical protein
MDMGKEKVITKGCKLLLDAFQFVGISGRFKIPTKVKYNIYRQSREENEMVKVRTSPNNVIKSKSVPLHAMEAYGRRGGIAPTNT